MDRQHRQNSSIQLSLLILIAAGVFVQIIAIQPLWGHISDQGDFLGRYSYSYLVVLILHLLLTIGWVTAFILHQKFGMWLNRLSLSWRYGLIITLTMMGFIIWLINLRRLPNSYVAVNLLVFVLCLVVSLPDNYGPSRWWFRVLVIAVGLMLIPTFFSSLTNRSFSPDEAAWADYTTSPFVAGGQYLRTWLETPITIMPGRGWFPVIYGWLLENVWFDIKLGRILNFLGYLAAFAGIGAVTWKLYGRQAAVVSAGFAVLSRAFIPSLDFRPDHQLPAIAMLITFTALQSRLNGQKPRRFIWDMLCGFIATLSLQVHAAGIVYIFGFSLFYAAEYAICIYRDRSTANFKPLFVYSLGLLIGLAVFYICNIAPVGGLERYLQILIQTRYSAYRALNFLTWPSFFERLLIFGSLAYILWRRSEADKLILGIIFCVVIGISLFDTQGYNSTFTAFYVIPIGTLFVDGMRGNKATAAETLRRNLAIIVVAVFLLGQLAGLFIRLDNFGRWLQTGEFPPYLYTELQPVLRPRVSSSDVVVSTHQLIWTIPDHPHLVSFAAEATGMERWGLSEPVEVWERVRPTVIIHVEHQMHFDPGLQAYMSNHQFAVCETLNVLNTAITIYREQCES